MQYNSEPQSIATTSRPAIANTLVGRSAITLLCPILQINSSYSLKMVCIIGHHR